MSTVSINSTSQFSKLLSSSNVVVADFYADWCGPCKTISPTYESLSTKYSKPNRITFTKVDVDSQQEIAQQYGVRAMPTFLIFRSGSVITTIKGADARGLTNAVESAVKLAGASSIPAYSSTGRTLGGGPPRSGQSLSRGRGWNFKGILDAIIAFVGLYLYSLFSLDAYAAAEQSPFNVNRTGSEKPTTGTGAAGRDGKRSGAAAMVGKKLGTIQDLTGGD